VPSCRRTDARNTRPGSLPSAAVEDRWAFEVKQDGQRAMVYLPGDGTPEE